MRKGMIIGVAIVVVLILGVVGLQFFGIGKKVNNQNQSLNDSISVNNHSNSDVNKTIVSGKSYNVIIQEFAFIPQLTHLKVGDSIIWTNRDIVQHSIVSDSGGELNSNLLPLNGVYTHTFNQIGTYAYHDSLHLGSHGIVYVD
jgi:plastocyanin